MTARYYALLLFSLLTSAAFAQRKNIYFLKNNGKYVDNRDSADYTRIVSEPDSASEFYNLKEYYKNGNPKRIGKIATIETVQLEGQCLTYFPTGKRKELATYKHGAMVGDVYDYYPNGKLYTVKQNSNDPKTHELITNIRSVSDSTGKQLVTDGDGYYVGYDDDFKYIEEEGPIKAGIRDGDWKGMEVIKQNTTNFIEKYQDGKLLYGVATKDGETTKYTKRVVQPEFKGGETAFARFLTSNVHYPDYEKERNIQGRVIIKFIVERDGKLTGLEVYKKNSPGLMNEALRVIKQSPDWIPGYRFGQPVRVQFMVPINFSLR